MRSRKNDTVCARQVHDRAGAILQESLAFVDHGYRCTVKTLFLILFFAAGRMASLHDACRRLRRAPTDQAVRNALLAQLPKMPELERRLNRALSSKLPKNLRSKRRPMAIDVQQTCYYGKPGGSDNELCRGKRKQGTSHFHCYATLCIVRRGERYTVALTYVWKSDSNAQIVRRLLEQARSKGLRPRYLLLDRGFYGMDVVSYLKSVKCPFLMPVVHRGRKPKKLTGTLKGTRRFLTWRRSGFSSHEMDNRKQKEQVNICVVCPVRRKGRRGGRKSGKRSKIWVFAYWGFRPASPAWTARQYRTRYGIESSYRQMNQGRVRTCTRDVRLRLLFVGIALLLRNVWVWLHHTVLGRVRGRGVELHLELLRLRTMLLMLQRCAEACFGCTEELQNVLGPPLAAGS
jgi:DDE family transposase